MSGADLLRLYPRAWRERYGDEFLALVGDRRLGLQQVIDILSGAIDAWLSSDVRRAVQPQGVSYHSGGSAMLKAICADSNVRFSKRDSLIGAGVILAWSALFAVLMTAAKQQGWETTATILMMVGFPGSVVVSMPCTSLKGQPWKAQIVMVGGLMAVLVGIAYLSTII